MKNKINCKRAQGMHMEKGVKVALVLFLVALVSFGAYKLNSSGILSNILPTFGIEDNANPDTTPKTIVLDGKTLTVTEKQYVVELIFKDKNHYFFRYDSQTKNNLDISMRFQESSKAEAVSNTPWYADPLKDDTFRGVSGFYPEASERNKILLITSQTSFDAALKMMAFEIISNTDVDTSYGTFENGEYKALNGIYSKNYVKDDPILIKSLKAKLTGVNINNI